MKHELDDDAEGYAEVLSHLHRYQEWRDAAWEIQKELFRRERGSHDPGENDSDR